MSVEYWLDVKFLGLTSTAIGVPNAALLQQRTEPVLVRAREPPVRPQLVEEAKGTLKGALGKQKGDCRIVATMPINVSMQNYPLKLKIDIDNRQAMKAVIGVILKLHREIKVKGKNSAGQEL